MDSEVMLVIGSGLFIFFLSWGLTRLMRSYALSTNLMDVPNDRSSHSIPTPRGGGLAFVSSFVLVFGCLFILNIAGFQDFYSLVLPTVLVAVLGFLDDRYQLSSILRLVAQLLIAVFALYLLINFSVLPVFKFHSNWVIAGGVVTALYLVWMLNLFNFMDGIDGIASVEAITVCLGGAILHFLQGNFNLALPPMLLALSVAGFLVLNFPPAHIFMGDVGSGFLGFLIGLFSIQAMNTQFNLFWCWLILSAVFITDATFTLLVRAWTGKRIFEAHRNHAYQHAALLCGSHLKVTLAVLIVNLIWLLPLAILVESGLLPPFWGLLLAYFPLIFTAYKLKAGLQKQNFVHF